MSKRRQRKSPHTDNSMVLEWPAAPGATGYTIHGIAPIPVKVDVNNMPTRIEPTSTGYNLYYEEQ